MVTKSLTIFVACILTGAVFAADPAPQKIPLPEQTTFTCLDGEVFKDVTVERIERRRLIVSTANGPRSLRYVNLPDAVKLRYFPPSMLHPPQVGVLLDFKTADGTPYKGTLRQVLPIGIAIETDSGISTLNFTSLPPELANDFNYEPEDADRFRLAEQAAIQKAAKERADAEAKTAKSSNTRNSANQNSSGRQEQSRGSSMGERGTQNLGAPRLGGSGLGK